MKYFTSEELEDITSELLNSPTRETLATLNQKYNGSSEVKEGIIEPTTNIASPIVQPIPNINSTNNPVAEPIPSTVNTNPSLSPISNLNVSSAEVPKEENIANNQSNVIPSIELPKLETPVFNNQNNNPVNFSGNLWQQPETNMETLMQTTDNFVSPTNVVPNTEVPVTTAPFFGSNQEVGENPIPVGNSPSSGPTMFGQFEQNYM